MVRVISLSVLMVLIVFLGGMFFQVVAPFLLPLFLAGIAAVLCQPLFRYFLSRSNQKVMLSAGLTTSVVLLAILVPLSVATIMASAQLYVISQNALTEGNWNRSIEWIKHELEFDSLYARAEPYLLPLFYPEAKMLDLDDRESNFDDDEIFPILGEMSPPDAPSHQNEDDNPSRAVRSTAAENDPGFDEEDPPVVAWRPFDPIPDDIPASTQEALEELENRIAEVKAKQLLRKQIDQFKEQLRSNMQSAILSLTQRSINVAGQVAGSTVNTTLDILGGLVTGLLGFVMFSIALFFFLADGPAMLAATQELIPVHREYQRELWSKFDKVVRAVVLATFLAAIGQGLLTSMALYIAGFKHFFIIWLIATTMSLIPLAGNWLVWGPCAAWMAYQGEWWTAIWLTLFGLLVVSTVDNVIKTYVLQSDAKLHPLLAFVSVLGGLKVMGLAGIFVAPIVASCLHALVKIFNAELKAFSKQRFGQGGGDDDISSSLLNAEFDQPDADESESEGIASVATSKPTEEGRATPEIAAGASARDADASTESESNGPTVKQTSAARNVTQKTHPSVKRERSRRRKKR